MLNPKHKRYSEHLEELAKEGEEIAKLEKQLGSAGIKTEISEIALDKLTELGFNPALGARPLKRVIQKEIQDKLSSLILSGEIDSSSIIGIDYKGDNFDFTVKE